MNLNCGGASCLMTLKKQDSSFYLHKQHGRVRAMWVDKTKQGQLPWVADSSLFILKTSLGSWDSGAPEEAFRARMVKTSFCFTW